MSDEFKLPDIGEGLAEGEIVKWLVAVGDTVVEDQPLVEVMTDKATVEVPSPRGGTVEALPVAEGEIVEIGTTILVFGDGGAAAPAAAAAPVDEAPAELPVTADELDQAREVAKAEREAAEASASERKPWEAPTIPGGAVAPAARRLAAELDVDVAQVPGSGRGGLVTKEDVRAFAGGETAAAASAPRAETAAEAPEAAPADAPEPEPAPVAEPAAAPEPEPATASTPVAPSAAAPAGGEERVPLRGLRRTIAERMVVATTTVPHYTYVEEADMTEVVALRRQAKPKAAERGVKLTFLPFIIHALVLTLKEHPYLNASLDEEAGEIILKRTYNIGIATNTERGLMVPVVKGADERDLLDLAAEITRLSDQARGGKIALGDLQGGTFTITSTGNIGGLLATPVINVPEVAILGVTSIRERPVVRHGEIVIRHMVNLSLSCDHRVVDGAVAALFMRDLVGLLEDPKLQLLASL
jgi:pyruvate dehydrogenase E2 component (dihydrolipoamide acetyltransferase)